jgi:hypothetical protein
MNHAVEKHKQVEEKVIGDTGLIAGQNLKGAGPQAEMPRSQDHAFYDMMAPEAVLAARQGRN